MRLTKLSMFLSLVLALMLDRTDDLGGAPAAAQDDEALRFVFVTHDLGAGISRRCGAAWKMPAR